MYILYHGSLGTYGVIARVLIYPGAFLILDFLEGDQGNGGLIERSRFTRGLIDKFRSELDRKLPSLKHVKVKIEEYIHLLLNTFILFLIDSDTRLQGGLEEKGFIAKVNDFRGT